LNAEPCAVRGKKQTRRLTSRDKIRPSHVQLVGSNAPLPTLAIDRLTAPIPVFFFLWQMASDQAITIEAKNEALA